MEERLWREHRPMVEEFNFSPYLKPAYYRLVWVPLAKLEFWTAYRVWVALQVVAFLSAMTLLGKRYGLDSALVLLLPMCPYLLLSFTWGQDTGLLLLILALSLELSLRGRESWGGATLALGLFKWNTILLLPLLFLVQKRWRTLRGFAAVALVEVVLSVWITGIGGVRDYFALATSPETSYWSYLMPSVRGVALAVGAPASLSWALALGAIAVFLWRARGLDLEKSYAAGVSIGVFLAIHTMGYDLLLPVMAIVMLYDRLSVGWKAPLVVLYLSPMPYMAQKLTDFRFNGLAAALFALVVAIALSLQRREQSLEAAVQDESPKAMRAGAGSPA
ncbi:MAG: glycosyltransferase family 87 protein [Bryobacterales bacterium]